MKSARRFDSVVFDLDGTLWDTRAIIVRARNAVARKLDLNVPSVTVEDVRKTMGLPVDEVYRVSWPTLNQTELAAVKRDLPALIDEALASATDLLYPGVFAGLERLAAQKPIFIVSNCSESYLESFLDGSGSRSVFTDCECYGRTGLPKGTNLSNVVRKHGLQTPVYVGDTDSDRIAAVQAQTAFIHAAYGFGELPSGDHLTAQSFEDVLNLVL